MTDLKNQNLKASISSKHNLFSTLEAGSPHSFSLLSDEGFSSNNRIYNDRFVLSKGQDSPLLNALFSFSGTFTLEETKIQRNFRSHDNGDNDLKFDIVDGACESSDGHALSIGAGLALDSKNGDYGNKIYVLLSGDELEKGLVWEAANFASYHKLGNLIAIMDINHISGRTASMYGFHSEDYEKRFRAFGFEAFTIDEDLNDIDTAFYIAHQSRTKPIAIIVNDLRGNGISRIKNKDSVHGKSSGADQLWKALVELDLM
ncbi:transketolase [Algoriphagus ratkowskyi]|nr:hypothetical protein [Algoriphagus ratkowskyi]PZX53509.1 transketolase [Algoriphagus ratkowskyi]